jgi:TctA family transporter
MLKSLEDRRKVNNKQLFLILCALVITAILTAWLGSTVTSWLSFDNYEVSWWLAETIVIFFGYQVIILIVGFSLGMFHFFWKYEKKILRRLGVLKTIQK